MDYWLGFFRGAGDNIFDAIAVAASDHPAALRSRRDAFAQRLYMLLHPEGAASIPSICSSDRADVIADDGGVPCREDPVAAETERIKDVLLNDQERQSLPLPDTLTVRRPLPHPLIHSSMPNQLIPAISLLSTTNCFSPKHRWPEDVAWHPGGELIFAMYSTDNGDSQVSVMNRSISGQVRTLLEVAHFFTSIASDHAVNKKMIHGTTRKCTRICILLLSWVLLDYSKKNAILSVGSDKRIIPFDLAAGRAGSKISYKIVFLLCPIPTLLKKEG
uniref:Uncharacterized protein n=1 Tax=Oryza rufipogon TaxID=4529 RepID=A0A0E0QL37_ORYRU